jgi:hypothetical protein
MLFYSILFYFRLVGQLTLWFIETVCIFLPAGMWIQIRICMDLH